jgi:hypothetical protein
MKELFDVCKERVDTVSYTLKVRDLCVNYKKGVGGSSVLSEVKP